MTAAPLDVADVADRIERVLSLAKGLELAIAGYAAAGSDELGRRALIDASINLVGELQEFHADVTAQRSAPPAEGGAAP